MIAAGVQAGSNLLTTGLNWAMSNQMNKQNYEYGEKAAQNDFNRQMEYYNLTHEHNSPEYKAQQYKDAGLNSALMYGQASNVGGAGESGGASKGTGGTGTAPQMQSIDVANMAKISAEIDLIKAQAENQRADAGNKTAGTETENAKRSALVDLMKQQAVGQQLENMGTKWKYTHDGKEGAQAGEYSESALQELRMNSESIFAKQNSTEIGQMVAQIDKTASETIINNQKAAGIFKEMVIAQMNAETNKAKQLAEQLEKEWKTGDRMNAMSWFNVAGRIYGGVLETAGVGADVVGKLMKLTGK